MRSHLIRTVWACPCQPYSRGPAPRAAAGSVFLVFFVPNRGAFWAPPFFQDQRVPPPAARCPARPSDLLCSRRSSASPTACARVPMLLRQRQEPHPLASHRRHHAASPAPHSVV